MKPKIGQTVYTLEYERLWYEWQIIPERVFALGESSFVVDDYKHKTPSAWEYSGYGKTWFSSLDAAKSYADKSSGKRIKWRSLSSDGVTSYHGSKYEYVA